MYLEILIPEQYQVARELLLVIFKLYSYWGKYSIISIVSKSAYRNDPSIRELCALQKTEKVEIMNLGYELLEQCKLVLWLKQEMES